MTSRPRIEFLFQPARSLERAALAQLTRELRGLAARVRESAPLPHACEPGGLARRALALARDPDGALCGFASARLLPVAGLGEALYLEGVRAVGTTREPLALRLSSALVRGYCLRFTFPARLWCVFDAVGPSRVAERPGAERALGASFAVDEAARRLTPPAKGGTERWASWLGAAFTPVARFEIDERVLESGFVRLPALLALELRRRLGKSTWTGPAPASISGSAA
jgi:hypothetical protein